MVYNGWTRIVNSKTAYYGLKNSILWFEKRILWFENNLKIIVLILLRVLDMGYLDYIKKRKVGFTCSTFDLFHAGHYLMLKDAKSKCDILVVGLQTDPTIDE